ncbi:flavoprotein [Micromonospora acroterricola]|uniref:Flavoprotein n=1 Tax=Micromonospora acroterricola TaxID=2202421 RepID=A0A317DBS9_9ACTN|nr:flavoprotein [Micromonospora acroterricola]PWR12077.1 flavoprotein [Micromonospora acroterricola]
MTDKRVLYLVVCAAPPALQIGELIDLLMADGWAVCVIATPTAATWIDREALSEQTGYPVRSEWRRPGEPDVLPKADAVVVAPATFNTINKWALGISDNLALGILNEALGLHLPIVVLPHAKPALAAHPAFTRNLDQLHANGVAVAPADESQASNHERTPWLSLVKAMER